MSLDINVHFPEDPKILALLHTLTQIGDKIMAQLDDLTAALEAVNGKVDAVATAVGAVETEVAALITALQNSPAAPDLSAQIAAAQNIGAKLDQVSAVLAATPPTPTS